MTEIPDQVPPLMSISVAFSYFAEGLTAAAELWEVDPDGARDVVQQLIDQLNDDHKEFRMLLRESLLIPVYEDEFHDALEEISDRARAFAEGLVGDQQ